MATYLGFSTQNACQPKTTNALSGSAGGPGGIRQTIIPGKKFTLVDYDLVIQDFINALNIRRGTKVGQPGYGTILWDLLFEQNIAATQAEVENEVRRLAGLDPRIVFNLVKTYPYNNGILIEMQIAVQPINEPIVLKINLNTRESTATLL
jgi:phage baseplate assembly protein W